MAGNTSAIDLAVLRVQWESQIPMAAICTHWTVTKDQLVRLRDHYALPKRHDRSLRYKPPRDPGPDDAEELASRESLSLAPQIAARVTCVQAMWTEQTRLDRTMPTAPGAGMLRWINAKEIVQRFARDELQGEG
jgi:hypothetical protein